VAELYILSAGAAQAVIERTIDAFTRDTGHTVVADFGAVGAMKAKMTGGARADVIVLTAPLIDELISEDWVKPGSRHDLGRVGTGVAVRAGTTPPDVSTPDSLKAALLAASTIAFPDPAVATAGKVVMQMFERLGVVDALRDRVHHTPNGYAAMKWLAATKGGEMGITQISEILPNPGVTLAGPLPDAYQMKAMYSAGLASRSTVADAAAAFIARLTDPAARPMLAKAGYELT
jgi:molybdate transport system substrate-binding protein